MAGNMITHELLVNVESGAYTAKPPLDIHQGDPNSHVILIKLRNDAGKAVSVDDNSKPKISFQRQNSTRVYSDAVDVVNPYRGVLSYTVGPALVKDYGRYTCRLDISSCECGHSCSPSITFVVNVSKSDKPFGPSMEVAITEEFYQELEDHLVNTDIHLDEADREFLRQFNYMNDELQELLDTDFNEMINSQVSKKALEVLSRAMITVDFEYQLKALTRDQVCEGKIVKVNYRGDVHDGNTQTIEDHEREYCPEYYVCKLIGDDETIEWHKISIGAVMSEEFSRMEKQFDELLKKFDQMSLDLKKEMSQLTDKVNSYSDRIAAVESCLTWGSFEDEEVEE